MKEPITDNISFQVDFCLFTDGEIALHLFDLAPSVKNFAVIGRLQLKVRISEFLEDLREGFKEGLKDALKLIGNVEIFYLNLPAVVKSASGIDEMPSLAGVIRVDIHELSQMDGFKNIVVCLQLGSESVESQAINVKKKGQIEIPGSSETSLHFYIPQVNANDNVIKMWWKKNARRMSLESSGSLEDSTEAVATEKPFHGNFDLEPIEHGSSPSGSSTVGREKSKLMSNTAECPTFQSDQPGSSTDPFTSKRFFLDMWQSDDSDESSGRSSDVDPEALYAIIDVSQIHEHSINGSFPMIPSGTINLTAALVHMDHSQLTTDFAMLEVFIGKMSTPPEYFLMAKVSIDKQSKEFLAQANEPDFFGQYCKFLINDPSNHVLTIKISEVDNSDDLGQIEIHMSDLIERENMTMEKESFLVQGSKNNLLIEMTIKLSGLHR